MRQPGLFDAEQRYAERYVKLGAENDPLSPTTSKLRRRETAA